MFLHVRRQCRDARSTLSELAEENLRSPEDDATYAEIPWALAAQKNESRMIQLHPTATVEFVTMRSP